MEAQRKFPLFSLVFFLNSTEFTLDTATAEKKRKERLKQKDRLKYNKKNVKQRERNTLVVVLLSFFF